MKLYCLSNARNAEQTRKMQRLEAENICLFCPDGRTGHDTEQVVLRTDHWNVTPNEFPYAGANAHLLLVPHEHVTDMADLPAEAKTDFWTVLDQVRREYALDFYGLGVRNGDCRFTGGTIAHLHVHLLVGDPGAKDARPLRMRFNSRPADRTGQRPEVEQPPTPSPG